jgi:hypothetical protein
VQGGDEFFAWCGPQGKRWDEVVAQVMTVDAANGQKALVLMAG